MAKIRALFGAGGQFVLLPQRAHWLPVNDADFDNAPQPDPDFFMHDEAFYATDGEYAALALPDGVKIFAEEAYRLEQKRLEALALADLAKNLSAAQKEYDLEKLIEKIDFHLRQDDIFHPS